MREIWPNKCDERADDGGETTHCFHDLPEGDENAPGCVCCWCGDIFLPETDATQHGEYRPRGPPILTVGELKYVTKPTATVLKKAGIKTLSDLLLWSPDQLLSLKGMTKGRLMDIRESVGELRYTLKNETLKLKPVGVE